MGVSKKPEDRQTFPIVVPATKSFRDDVTAMSKEAGYDSRADYVRDVLAAKVEIWKKKK